jgi:hypothetical protein
MMHSAQPPLESNWLDRVPSVARNLRRAPVKVYGPPVGEANEILVAHGASCG